MMPKMAPAAPSNLLQPLGPPLHDFSIHAGGPHTYQTPSTMRRGTRAACLCLIDSCDCFTIVQFFRLSTLPIESPMCDADTLSATTVRD